MASDILAMPAGLSTMKSELPQSLYCLRYAEQDMFLLKLLMKVLLLPDMQVLFLLRVTDKMGIERSSAIVGGLEVNPSHGALQTWLNWQKHFPAEEGQCDRHEGCCYS